MDIVDQTKKKMQACIDHLKAELKTLRTGRANAGMVENVSVEVYGTHMRLKDIASISIPEPRQILISPFDGKNAGAISKAVTATINMQAYVDGNSVRVKVPEMDSKVRQEMAKIAKKKGEEAKVSVRNVRRDSNTFVKEEETSGKITEDIRKKHEKTIQELTDKFCKNVDEVVTEKEKEILTI